MSTPTRSGLRPRRNARGRLPAEHAQIQRVPPVETDFLSYEALGKPYDRRDFFKGTGVSMHTPKSQSLRIALTYGAGAGIARVDLRHPSVVWARSDGKEHITDWAPGDILVGRVLECEGHE